MQITEGNTILDSIKRRVNGVTNKKNTITLLHRKVDKIMSYEGEIFDYVLYSKA